MLECREAIDIPRLLLDGLLSEKQTELLEAINSHYGDKSVDQFRDFFQEEQADRKSLKQDYTPDAVAELVGCLAGSGRTLLDVCAGSGALTVAYLAHHTVDFVRCEEFSSRVIPFLLVNLSIRNIDGEVIHGNSLTREHFAVYRLSKSERFSLIEKVKEPMATQFDTVISNPPYSMPWTPVSDERFDTFGLAPASKSDFAFLLHGFHQLDDGGKMVVILPHGVLFRGASEGIIRQQLLQRGNLSAIIGLPDKLFLNTSIPVTLIELVKKRDETNTFFIDASKEFEKGKKQNILTAENVEVILSAYRMRRDIDRFAHLATLEEIRENDYNLNIPRYVSTYVPEPVTPLGDILQELIAINKEIRTVEADLLGQFENLVSTLPEREEELEANKRFFRELVELKQGKGALAKEEQLSLF